MPTLISWVRKDSKTKDREYSVQATQQEISMVQYPAFSAPFHGPFLHILLVIIESGFHLCSMV